LHDFDYFFKLLQSTAELYDLNGEGEKLFIMTEEFEDDITELELEDDALEKRMRKLENEAARLLNHSNELIQALRKETAKQEETKQEETKQEETEVKSLDAESQ
jgi:hypothetical protein